MSGPTNQLQYASSLQTLLLSSNYFSCRYESRLLPTQSHHLVCRAPNMDSATGLGIGSFQGFCAQSVHGMRLTRILESQSPLKTRSVKLAFGLFPHHHFLILLATQSRTSSCQIVHPRSVAIAFD